tara:strand:+ start:679 stop:924 length:246 start_codon:yes stop_codon:yes gene_type:complete
MFTFIYTMFKGRTPESFTQAHVWFKTNSVEELVEYRNTIDSKYHYIIDTEIVARINTFPKDPAITPVTIYDYVDDPKVTSL